MSSRLGTAYAHEVNPTDTYQVLAGDDVVNPIIASDKTITLPAISSLGPDDVRKTIGNDSTSVGVATYAAASGDSLRGQATFPAGQYCNVIVEGRTWIIGGTGATASSAADSKGVSAGTRASVADSKAVSDSVIASTNDSSATSRATSNSGNTSIADSKGVSNSVVISSLTSRVSSKGN